MSEEVFWIVVLSPQYSALSCTLMGYVQTCGSAANF